MADEREENPPSNPIDPARPPRPGINLKTGRPIKSSEGKEIPAIPPPSNPINPAGSSRPVINVRTDQPINKQKDIVYDFSPFLSAPAITALAKGGNRNQLRIISIPETRIPSPLARNILPKMLLDLKEFLVGKGKQSQTQEERNGNGNGNSQGWEVWLSWKRSWDIWNNYYIHGRVDPVWLAKQLDEEDGKRETLAGGDVGVGGDGTRQEAIKKKSPRKFKTVKRLVTRQRLKPGQPTRKVTKQVWRKRPGVVTLVPKTERKQEWRLVRSTEFLPIRTWAANVAKRQTTGAALSNKSSNSRGVGLEPTQMRRVMVYRDVGVKEWKKVKLIVEKKTRVIGWGDLMSARRLKQAMPIVNDLLVDPVYEQGEREEWVPVYETRISEDGGFELIDVVEEVPGTEMEDYQEVLEEQVEQIEEEDEEELVAGDKEDEQEIIARDTTDDPSGGYFAMKNFPEYLQPATNYDNDSPEWDDVISNTVWRPRRVGEKTVKIDLDDDVQEFLKDSKLQVDGGVDCGRSPYPVLRSTTEDIPHAEGILERKKVWDGVTGTIFNMPTKPLEPVSEPEDVERARIARAMFGAVTRDLPRRPQPDIFPLDIRRVMRIDESTAGKKAADQRVVLPVTDKKPTGPQEERRNMTSDDPWWVTDEQKERRDRSSSRFTITESESNANLESVDDTLWKEDMQKDLMYDARYFVTNLHGDTLLVNGMEVRKGEIAGPLPAFAVIECPGGQVAFWWGENGRNWGEGPEEPDFEEQRWDVLRRMEGWEHVGLTAGKVWDGKIQDKKRKTREGEDDDEDEEWEIWRRAKRVKTGNGTAVGSGNAGDRAAVTLRALPAFWSEAIVEKPQPPEEKDTSSRQDVLPMKESMATNPLFPPVVTQDKTKLYFGNRACTTAKTTLQYLTSTSSDNREESINKKPESTEFGARSVEDLAVAAFTSGAANQKAVDGKKGGEGKEVVDKGEAEEGRKDSRARNPSNYVVDVDTWEKIIAGLPWGPPKGLKWSDMRIDVDGSRYCVS